MRLSLRGSAVLLCSLLLVSVSAVTGRPLAGERAGSESGPKSSGPPATFDITTKKPDDRVEVEAKEAATVFTVISRSGIGNATISRRNGGWHGRVVLRLRLAGLESLTVSSGRVKLAASVLSHSGHPRLLRRIEKDQEKSVDKDSPFWLEIKMVGGQTVPLKGGYFEMTLPAALFQDGPKSLKIEWIDFYRG